MAFLSGSRPSLREATDVVDNLGSCFALSPSLDYSVTLSTLCYGFISNARNNDHIYIYIYIC